MINYKVKSLIICTLLCLIQCFFLYMGLLWHAIICLVAMFIVNYIFNYLDKYRVITDKDVVFPDTHLYLSDKAKADLQAGLDSAKRGEIAPMGSFTKYVDDDTKPGSKE